MAEFQYPVTSANGVTRIDLGRPEEGNSITRGMMRDLAETIRLVAADPQTKVIVIEGKGAFFCKGRDGRGESTEGLRPHEVREQMMGAVLGVYAAIQASPVPVVSCVCHAFMRRPSALVRHWQAVAISRWRLTTARLLSRK